MLRLASFLLLAAAIAVSATASAAPVSANPKAKGRIKILGPLTLRAVRNLEFGTIILNNVTEDNFISVGIDGTGQDCGIPGQVTCMGGYQSARYNVQGTKGAVVRIRSVDSNLVNTTSGGGETLKFTSSRWSSFLTLTNSGAPGDFFNVGGFIIIGPSTVDGVYVGDISITVEYQ